ncbi:MAG: hypothetical protein AAF467_17690 [Actinomycetota bacterium]
MSVEGADLEAMSRLSRLLGQQSGRINSIRTAAGGALGVLNRLWRGSDAAAFEQQWRNVHAPALARAGAALRDAAEMVERNRAAQEQTSAQPDSGGSGWDWVTSTLVGEPWGALTSQIGPGPIGPRVPGLPSGDSFLPSWSDALDPFIWVGEQANDLAEASEPFFDETGHRFGELWAYNLARGERRFRNPFQAAWDDVTWTGPFEHLTGSGAILFGGGEFDDSIGNGRFEGIYGVPGLPGRGAITLGHSVLFGHENAADITSELSDHEYQHVLDIEDVGGLPFYGSYLAQWGVNIAMGQDPAPRGEAYRNIFWEDRGFAVQFGQREPQGIFDDALDEVGGAAQSGFERGYEELVSGDFVDDVVDVFNGRLPR